MAIETLKRLFEHYTNSGQTERAEEMKERIELKGGKVKAVKSPKKVKKMEEESEEE